MTDFYWAKRGLRWMVFCQTEECTEGEPFLRFWRERTAAQVTLAMWKAYNRGRSVGAAIRSQKP